MSRKDLFDGTDDTSTFQLKTNKTIEHNIGMYELPADLELVEVNVKDESHSENAVEEEKDEFEFPLFSSSVVDNSEKTAVEGNGLNDKAEASSTRRLMKVSLREPTYEQYNQERPATYYFAKYSDEDRQRFAKSAVDYDTIMKEVKLGPYKGWSRFRGAIVDLKEYNNSIESSILRESKLRKRKPGKKQRLAKKMGIQRENERQERAKEIKKMIKKKFHKRGGRKNKKKADSKPPIL